jgi:hypothetical protein
MRERFDALEETSGSASTQSVMDKRRDTQYVKRMM